MFIIYKPDIHRVRGKDIRNILNSVEPGDILLRRFDQYVNTLCTPGFFSHAGIFVGDNDVVHSVSSGCIREDLLNFCRTDAIAILRSKNLYSEAVNQATLMSQMNLPYDYEFSSTNESYYCTETVDVAHDHMFKNDYSVVAGNKLLTPDAIYNSNKVSLILQVNYKP